MRAIDIFKGINSELEIDLDRQIRDEKSLNSEYECWCPLAYVKIKIEDLKAEIIELGHPEEDKPLLPDQEELEKELTILINNFLKNYEDVQKEITDRECAEMEADNWGDYYQLIAGER